VHSDVNVLDSHGKIGGLLIDSTMRRKLGSITNSQKCDARSPSKTTCNCLASMIPLCVLVMSCNSEFKILCLCLTRFAMSCALNET
jgi:hypothetical protein